MEIQDYFDILNKQYFENNKVGSQNVQIELLLKTDLMAAFENHLKLIFVDEEVRGNVCFAADSDVRVEFRTTFRAIDLIDYLRAVRNDSKIPLKITNFQFPIDTALFWKYVALGSQLRKDI